MAEINYFFENTKNCRHQLPAKKWIKNCLKKEKKELGCINFIFCSDDYLQEIHKKYLNKTYLTDVITFNTNYETPPKLHLISGDVFISIDRVKENKKTYKIILRKEIQRVMIHGVLHLMGYKDLSQKEKKLMRNKENLYINLL